MDSDTIPNLVTQLQVQLARIILEIRYTDPDAYQKVMNTVQRALDLPIRK